MDFVRRLTGPPLKRLYKYLLRKSVGTYLLGELTVDQLDIQIIEGEVNLKGLQVNAAVVNSHLEGTPFRIRSGSIGRIHLSVPLASLLSKPVVIEIMDLAIVLEPPPDSSPLSPPVKPSSNTAVSGPNGAAAPDAAAQEGLDVLAALVNKVLSQLLVRVINFQLILPHSTAVGHALCLRVPLLELTDETPSVGQSSSSPASDPGLAIPDIVHKCITAPDVTVTLITPGGDSVLLRAASAASATRVKVIVNTAPHIHRQRPGLDVNVFVHEVDITADPRRLGIATDILQQFAPLQDSHIPLPTPPPPGPSHPLAASAVLDAIPLVATAGDEEDALEVLGGPGEDSLVGLGCHMFASAVGFGSVAHVAVFAAAPPPPTFALRCDVIACTLTVPLVEEGGSVCVLVGGASLTMFTGEPTVVSVNEVAVCEERHGRESVSVGGIGTAYTATSAGHAMRIEVPVDPSSPVCVSVGALALDVDEGFVPRLFATLSREEEKAALPRSGHTPPSPAPPRSADRVKRTGVLLSCPGVSLRLGRLKVETDAISVEMGTLQGASHSSPCTSIVLASLRVWLSEGESDALLLECVQPRCTIVPSPCSWSELSFELFPEVTPPAVATPSGASRAVLRAWEDDEETAGVKGIPAPVVDMWGACVTQAHTSVALHLGIVMVDMSSAQYLCLLATIAALSGSGSSGASDTPKPPVPPGLPPLLLAVSMSEACIHYRRDALQRDLTLFATGFTLGLLLPPDPIGMDLIMCCQSIAVMSCVSFTASPPLPVCQRNPSTLAAFQPVPMLVVRVAVHPDARFGKKTQVFVDGRNALFPNAIAWDWIMDILDLTSPEDPADVPPPTPTPTGPNALSVIRVSITSSCILHTLPVTGGSARKPPGMVLRIGSLQLTCNVMKHVKEQGFTITARDVELLASQRSGFNCGATPSALSQAVFSMRARRPSAPLFASYTLPAPFPQVVACVFPTCTVDTEAAGFLSVSHLTLFAIKVRLPADSAHEAIVVEADGGSLTAIGCLDTLMLTVELFNHYGDAFADVLTRVAAIEKSGRVVEDLPTPPAAPVLPPKLSILGGVDMQAFGVAEAAKSHTPGSVVPAIASPPLPPVFDYFAPDRSASTASQRPMPIPVAPMSPPVERGHVAVAFATSPAPSEAAEEKDDSSGGEGVVLGWASDDDEGEFEDAEGEFGGVFGDMPVMMGAVGEKEEDEGEEDVEGGRPPVAPLMTTMSLGEFVAGGPVTAAAPPTPPPPPPATPAPLDGSADVGATEAKGVWYDGHGPGTVRVYAGMGTRAWSLASNPHYCEPPLAMDADNGALKLGHAEFGEETPTRHGALSLSFTLRSLDVSFKFFGGSDWSGISSGISPGLFDDEPTGPPGAHRRGGQCVEVLLSGIACSFMGYGHDDGGEGEEGVKWALDSVLVCVVRDVEVLDRIPESPLHLILGVWTDEKHPRAPGVPMLRLRIDKVLPTSVGPLTYLLSQCRNRISETRMRVSVLPLRAIIGQHAVDMVTQVALGAEEERRMRDKGEADVPAHVQVIVLDRIGIKADYEPGAVNGAALRHGSLAELVKLVPISGLEVTLVRVVAWNCSGWDAVGAAVAVQWANNIRQHQVHKLAAGINAALLPLHSVANVARGVGDVVMLPLKGGRARGRAGSDALISGAVGATNGLRTGLVSLVKAVTLEAIKAGVAVSNATQTVLETVSDVVGGDSVPSQPRGRGEGAVGLAAGMASVKRSLTNAAATIVTIPVREYKRKGAKGAVKAVVRALPVAILQPLIGTTQAVTKSLLGARNTLDKGAKEDDARKYKKR